MPIIVVGEDTRVDESVDRGLHRRITGGDVRLPASIHREGLRFDYDPVEARDACGEGTPRPPCPRIPDNLRPLVIVPAAFRVCSPRTFGVGESPLGHLSVCLRDANREESEVEGVCRMVVNPVVAPTAYGAHIVRVEDVAASRTGEDLVNIC